MPIGQMAINFGVCSVNVAPRPIEPIRRKTFSGNAGRQSTRPTLVRLVAPLNASACLRPASFYAVVLASFVSISAASLLIGYSPMTVSVSSNFSHIVAPGSRSIRWIRSLRVTVP